jgi:hypothetical protein
VNLADVMDELAAQLDTITGLRVTAFPAAQVQVPAAVVGLPEDITFDLTYGRGVDQMNIPVFVLVGNVWDRTARDEIAAYVDGSGTSSIKAVLEAGTYTAMSSVRVASATFETVSVAAVEYLAATFSVDVYGTGE